ncbi:MULTISPECIES: hypothetical protein [Legionella]|uniref:Uncharacterized protein n=1 Tax=Legionella resiliens TaxID=2905958 RepID=A0ABS8X3S4_9GAMM|nr:MULTISPECIES: hypothetical protein [unclassified Legionella]MCE0723251.1 hypothetical protein [Legionella sp. 9fVS26]MCE3532404.1 hypothetical protein [Legionella sp. 8cVS16]QLZ68544.1 hypothetical protein FOLKNPGA_01323 [Legionella sp. PC1000]
MPSNQLALLCQHIEKQKTDHFGKFYMYVSLLNTLTVRDKTFTEGLPKYSGSFWQKNHLNIGGELPVEFAGQLNLYAREFSNLQPNWTKTIHNIVMAYLRKGKITDLIYIIDQMLNHLTAMHGPQTHNGQIYKDIQFGKKKAGLNQFIEHVSAFNQQLLSVADNGCNTGLSVLAAATGAVLVLTSVFSIVPLIIGLPLVIGGAVGTYYFATQAMAQVELLQTQVKQISEKMKAFPKDTSFFGDSNYVSFFASVVKPLPYVIATVGEQLMMDAAQQKEVEAYRNSLDDAFSSYSM